MPSQYLLVGFLVTGLESVAVVIDGIQAPATVRTYPELVSNATHVRVHGAGGQAGPYAPYILEDVTAGQEPSGILEHEQGESEFLVG